MTNTFQPLRWAECLRRAPILLTFYLSTSFPVPDHQLLFSPPNKEVPVEERNGNAHDEEMEGEGGEEEEEEVAEGEAADDEAGEGEEAGDEAPAEDEEEEDAVEETNEEDTVIPT